MNVVEQDKKRKGGKIPSFQYFMRLLQGNPPFLLRILYQVLFRITSMIRCIEIPSQTQIGGGLYIGHAYCITINSRAVIGMNVNIHRGVLIGQENRGKRKGYPTIGNNVWIGINSSVVGKINIGDDVLIAPNSYVNCDVPSHSIVFGNPCIIKHCENATADYVNETI